MSTFNELLLPKITELSKSISENFNTELQEINKKFDKFEEEFIKNVRGKTRDKNQKDKHVMQSILEDEVIQKTTEHKLSDISITESTKVCSTESDPEQPQRNSKKRNKNEVDDIFSPEVEKRQKRNASIKAQTNIAKQVNVNLTQKLRRENSMEKRVKTQTALNGKLRVEEDKENSEPKQLIQIKQEKISLPIESIEVELIPVTMELTKPVQVKQELTQDEMAMPPPAAPKPRPRRVLPKYKTTEEETSEDEPVLRRSTRSRKQKESITVQPPSSASSSKVTRSSSGASKKIEDAEEPAASPEPRPKRTRAKKKAMEAVNDERAVESQSSQDSGIASPAEKPRPKRTRRALKEAMKEAETKPQEPEELPTNETLKVEKITEPLPESPILQMSKKGTVKKMFVPDKKGPETVETEKTEPIVNGIIENDNITLDLTRVISQQDVDAVVPQEMDQTVVLPNGVYNHDQVTPKPINKMNETVVISKTDETVVIDKADKVIMNETVVIDKDPKRINVTEDNSIMTDDSEPLTPPKQNIPPTQPLSAVKEKVQQFEELASRVTRTKTRAMAKKQEEQEQSENQTPPDKIIKQILPMETLQKMNSMIFSGKPPLVSTSASKPRINGLNTVKSQQPTSTSKLSLVKKTREAVEERILREKEDARKKKEAILEAKKEQQRRKREEKMAAAAAVREAANKERQVALEAAARERMDRQAHADQGKLERLKEAERKKQELARKVAVTEERRKAEEQARQQRLEEEQKRIEALRKKQLEESEAWKKEAAIAAKEIEKKQKEYKEKLKMKQRFDEKIHTPLKNCSYAMEPVRMEDGFQYLISDDEDSDHGRNIPVPPWCMSKFRNSRLLIQAHLGTVHVDKLFSVRVHSPDLSEIFPGIERSRLKRTSSAVWRTPPGIKLPNC